MIKMIYKVCVMVCAGMATYSFASPLDTENLLLSPPPGFKVAYQKVEGRETLAEFVPQAESVQDWTEMLTVHVFRGAVVNSSDYLQDVGGRFVKACTGTTASPLMNGKTNGYAVSMVVLKCPLNPLTGLPETTVLRAIKGSDALYSVQHAWRAVPSDEQTGAVLRSLSKVTVCDGRTDEHPCGLDAVAH